MTESTNSEAQNGIVKILMDKEGYEKPLEQHTQFKEIFRVGRTDSVLLDNKTHKPFTGAITVFYNKTIAERRTYKDGLLDGSHLEYHDDGTVRAETKFKQGKENGPLVSYFTNGKLSVSSVYEDGQIITSKTFYESGKIATIYDGKTKKGLRYYEDGKLYAQDTYEKNDGQPGYTVYYYRNGYKDREGREEYHLIHYHDERGHGERRAIFRMGHWIYYHESTGQKKEEGEMGVGGRHADVNIRKDQWKVYDEQGKLIRYDYYEGMMGQITRSEPAKE